MSARHVLPPIRNVAKLLDGDVIGPGRIACPAPGSSRDKRNCTLLVDPRAPRGFVVYPFPGGDWRPLKDYVADRVGLTGGDWREAKAAGPVIQTPSPDDAEGSSERAERRWRRAGPTVGTPAEDYMRGRGIACPLPETMRYLPAYRDRPAMLLTACSIPLEVTPGVVTMKGVLVRAVHRIFLTPDGQKIGKKKFLGSPNGRPLVVAGPTEVGRGLVVAEGIEDALSAHMATGLAAWAGGTAHHMGELGPPSRRGWRSS